MPLLLSTGAVLAAVALGAGAHVPVAAPAPVAGATATSSAPSQARAAVGCASGRAVRVHPGGDVNRVVARSAPGATICFARGVYRLVTPLRPRAGQTLVGHGSVLTGSRRLGGFTRTARGWAVGDQHQQGERNGVCLGPGTACTYPDDVVADGRPLRRVLSLRAVGPGRYFFDYAAHRITVGSDPAGHVLEAMVAPTAILSRAGRAGADVTVRGFTVEHVASMAQHGAIETTAPGWLITGDTVQVDHGAGITANGHVRIIGNRVLRNGQLGIGGTGASTVVRGNVITGNDTGGFDPGWEAGGAKWALTVGLDVEGNRVAGNHGPGLWIDIDARHTTFAHNVVRDNARAGIFAEISVDTVIRDNVVTGNGRGDPSWLWGSGILLAGSHGARVTGNTLAGNAEGIGLVQQDRGRSQVDGTPRTLHDIRIDHNSVAMADGDSGGVTDDGFTSMFTDPTITWVDDAWHGSRGTPFAWADAEVGAARWRALGHDVHGTFH